MCQRKLSLGTFALGRRLRQITNLMTGDGGIRLIHIISAEIMRKEVYLRRVILSRRPASDGGDKEVSRAVRLASPIPPPRPLHKNITPSSSSLLIVPPTSTSLHCG